MFEADLIGDAGEVIRFRASVDRSRSTATIEVGDRTAHLTDVDVSAGLNGRIETIVHTFDFLVRSVNDRGHKIEFTLSAAGMNDYERLKIAEVDAGRFDQWVSELKL